MNNPAKAAKAAEAAVPELPPLPVPEFAWEINQNGWLVLPADFFTNLEGKKTKCLPADWFEKTAARRGFFDRIIVNPVCKNRVLRCMSVSGDDVKNWRSFVVKDGFRRMFDSFMLVICDKKMVATANEAELTMENGCKPKPFKEVATCFSTKSSKALPAMNDGQARLSAKCIMLLEVRFFV